MLLSCIPWRMITGWPNGTPEMSLEKFINLASCKYHLDGIEILNSYLFGKDCSYLKLIRRRLQENGLRVSQYTTDACFALDKGIERKHLIERLITEIDQTVFWGTNIMRVTGGVADLKISRSKSFERVIAGYSEVLSYAEERQVYLAFENHVTENGTELGGTLDEYVEIIKRINSPFFKANFDTGNAIAAGYNPLDFLKCIYPYLIHLHASDKRKKDHTILGEGDVDFPKIFNFLREQRYKGWVSVEYSLYGFEGLEKSIKYIKNFLTFESANE